MRYSRANYHASTSGSFGSSKHEVSYLHPASLRSRGAPSSRTSSSRLRIAPKIQRSRLVSQKLVVKKECERCPRVEEHEVDIATVRETGFSLDPDVTSCTVQVDGEEIGTYTYLCETCRDIVSNYVVSIFSVQKKVSSHRRRKPKEDEPEVTVEDAAE